MTKACFYKVLQVCTIDKLVVDPNQWWTLFYIESCCSAWS